MIKTTQTRIILGIDPGIADMGWGIIQVEKSKITMLDYGSVRTSAKEKIPTRLMQIYKELEGIIDEYKPSEVAIEELFFGKNAKTAMTVGQARGVAMLLLAQKGLTPAEFKPAEIKVALTGYGNATKKQIQIMVTNMLKLKSIPKPDDAADALAIAITKAVTNSKLKG